MAFEIIDTQEKLDQIIGARLKRESEKHAEEIAGINSKHQEEIAKYEKEKEETLGLIDKIKAFEEKEKETGSKITELEGEIKNYKIKEIKQKFAEEFGIASGLLDRIKGETEEEIKDDAMQMAQLLRPTAPIAGANDEIGGNGTNAAYKDMLRSMFND